MTLEIRSDTEYKYFEAVTHDMRFAGYPKAGGGRGMRTLFVAIYKKTWFEQLEDIASWVNNELKEECVFTIG